LDSTCSEGFSSRQEAIPGALRLERCHDTFLKIALLCVSLTCVGLIFLNIKTYDTFHNLKPLVIRINDLGRAEAISYGSLEYHPQESEIKYFLIQFVQPGLCTRSALRVSGHSADAGRC
jgi:type IV secretory pathway TrbF-like protein